MQFHCMAIMSGLLKCVMKPSASFLIFYDPSVTFLRHTCENTYDKASPRGACSPFYSAESGENGCVRIVSTFNVLNMEL